jgi:hypothetical protein
VFEIANKVIIKLFTKPPSHIEPVFLKKILADIAASGNINNRFHNNTPASADVILGGNGADGINLMPVVYSHP